MKLINEAMVMLSEMYGFGVEPDLNKAIHLLRVRVVVVHGIFSTMLGYGEKNDGIDGLFSDEAQLER